MKNIVCINQTVQNSVSLIKTNDAREREKELSIEWLLFALLFAHLATPASQWRHTRAGASAKHSGNF